jgi:hypothetical protein
MRRNLGDADRAARILIGTVLGFLFLGRRVPGTTGVVLGAGALYLLATSVWGWCPLYAMTRTSTRSAKDADGNV